MICKRCHLPMRRSPATGTHECSNGHRVHERSVVPAPIQTHSVEIPYEPPKPETDHATYKRRVERKLEERKKWLENYLVTEEEIQVDEEGRETFIRPDAEGRPASHEIPYHLTRRMCFSMSGKTYNYEPYRRKKAASE